MTNITAKNNTGVDIFLEDLGVTIPASSSLILTEIFEVEQITESNNLKTQVTNGDITINDGTKDLSISNGLLHIKFETEHEDEKTRSGTWIVDSTSPTQIDGEGFYKNVNGILYIYDEERGKWLSKNRRLLPFYKDGEALTEYLKIDELIGASDIGYLMPRRGVIVGATANSSSGDDPKDILIKVNDIDTETIQQSSYKYKSNNLNIDFNQGDQISCYIDENPKTIIDHWFDSNWDYRMKITLDHTKFIGEFPCYEGLTNAGHTPASTSRTFSHTIDDGDNRLLVVNIGFIGNPSGGVVDVTSVTYNGVNMTLAGNIGGTYNGWGARSVMYYMLEANLPSAGTYNVVVTFNKSADESHVGAINYTNIKQQAPIVATNAGDNDTSLSTSITTTSDDSLLIETLNYHNTGVTLTEQSNQITRWDSVGTYQRNIIACSVRETAGSGNVSWSASGGVGRWTHVIAAFESLEQNIKNFPFLISVTNSNLTKARADGYDIVFTGEDSTSQLDHEIEYFDNSTGELVAWVKIPALKTEQDFDIYIYYGYASSTNQQNPTGVWDSDYVAVYHMTGSSYTAIDDSTLNNNDINTEISDPAYNQTGKISNAITFDGNDAIEAPDSATLDITGPLTLSAWINPSSISNWNRIVAKSHTADFNPWTKYGLLFDDASHMRMEISTSTTQYGLNGTTIVQTGSWQYLVAVYTGSQMQLYYNGASDQTPSSVSITITTNDMPLSIARAGFASNYFTGSIDEVRVSNAAKSASWIATEYTNQNNPSSFYTFGTEETKDRDSSIINPVVFLEIAWLTI